MVDYKDRLDRAMLARSVTHRQLAAAIKISYQAVKKVTEGKSTAFTAENNSKVAKFLKISSDWLAAGDGEMTLEPETNSWPFSDELLAAIGKLDDADLWYAENTLRGSLKMAPLPMPAGNSKSAQQ